MKTPKVIFVVISTIGLASIVGIFVFAQSPSPTATGKDLPFHLVMHCAQVDKDKVKAAASPLPADTYYFEFEEGDTIGKLPADSSLTPCPAHFTGSATQRAKFVHTTELDAFLKAAGL